MKRLVKSMVRLLGALVVVVVLGAVVVNLLADNAARVAVERGASRALEVPVTVKKANLALVAGTLSLRDLTVANPPGYQQEILLDLERGDIRVEAGSLLSDVIAVKDIKLDGMKVALEQKGLDNNLHDVIESLRRDKVASGKKLHVDNLEITNITVSVKLLPIPGQADTVGFRLRPIKMTGLGRSQPLDIATLTTTVLLAVAEAISEQGGDALPRTMIDDLGGVLNKALDIGRILFGNGENGERSRK